ncbi:MAG TPA: AAA family ATPase [Methylomirabilota bacterium]|jgi:predicted kinase|nr:AAA family ATPase [Methylomirabilota bacterium]
MELVVLIGLPAAGKTSLYRRRFAATHTHVSKDLLVGVRDRSARQAELIADAFRRGQSVVVDNTNPTAADRAPLIALGRRHGARLVAYHLLATPREAVERNRRRENGARVPDVAIYVAARRLEPPRYAEGFDEIYRVEAAADGGFTVTAVPAET